MRVSLQPVTVENWRTLIELKVREDQSHFVASNLHSIAEAQFGFEDEGHWDSYMFGVYDGEEPVGFLMYAANPSHSEIQVFIMRLMVDEKFQGRGYGREAMLALLKMLKENKEYHVAAISYAPDNLGAKKLYTSLGFEDNGKKAGDEDLVTLSLR